MNNEELNVVKNTLKEVSEFGAHAVSEYAHWYFCAGIVWTLFGAMLITVSIKWNGIIFKDQDEKSGIALRFVLFFLGCVWIGVNVIDIFSPEAAGIHGVIRDLTNTSS